MKIDTNFDIILFKSRLKEITRDFFNSLEIGEICGFGFFSDKDAGSVNISYETKEHLQKMLAENPNEKMYYKWYPNEWIGDNNLKNLNKELYSNVQENNSNFENQKQNIFSMMVDVLKELKAESLFDHTDDNFVLVFNIMDYDNEEQEVQWLETLNDIEKSKEFRDWLLG